MKRFFSSKVHVLLLIMLTCCTLSHAQSTVNQYINPLDVSIADPHVLKDGNVYYLYGTSYDWNGFSVFTSTDMIHWSRRGLCWQKTAGSWGQSDFWAPEVIRVGSTYYLYYTAYNPASDRRNVCVATASSPLGPFVDFATPILPTNAGYIDGHPYLDPVSGKYYMYAVRETSPVRIFVWEMTNPPVSIIGNVTEVMRPSQSWETGWVEAPFLHYRNGVYYMMYSGKAYYDAGYAVGYATSSSPLGPFTKAAANPILKKTTTVSGPGHNGLATSPNGNELFIIYHSHLTDAGGGSRQLAIDRLQFTPNANAPATLALQAGVPTSTLQPLPSGAAPRQVGTSDEFTATSLDRQKWNVFGEEPTRWKLQNGQLVITTQNGDLHSDNVGGRNVFLQYAPTGDFDLETRVNFTPLANFEQAYIVLWQDQSNYIRLGSVYAGRAAFELGVERNGSYTGYTTNNTLGTSLRLKIERRGNNYTGYAGSTANGNWTKIGSTTAMTTLQPQVGLSAQSQGSGAQRTAQFEYLRIITTAGVDDWQLY